MKKTLGALAFIAVIAVIIGVCIYSCERKTCKNGGEHKWIEKTDLSTVSGESHHKDATCTEDGYIDYYCNYCLKEKREIIPATGHKEVVDKEGVAPTCSTYGYADVSHCSVCNETLSNGEVLEKLPHVTVKVGEDVAPTCTSTGFEAATVCTVCGETVTTDKVLPMAPHTPIIDIPAVVPSCVQTGMTEQSHCGICGATISVASPLPAVPDNHNFGNGITCVDCGKIDPDYSAIKTITDLQNINLNLNGKYYLANNIDLGNVAWEPIGRNYGSFTGTFEGNGFTIYNLNLSVSNDNSKTTTVGGLFEKNAGVIRNFTISNFTVNITFNEDQSETWSDEHGSVYATYGAFAGNNSGVIENCTISGTVGMTNTRTLKKYFVTAAQGGNDHTDRSTSYFGGITGINSGRISNCTNSATFKVTVYGWVESKMGLLGGVNTSSWNVAFFGDAGGIAGSNLGGGIISDCSVSGSFTFSSDLTAYCVSNVGVGGWGCQVQNSMCVGSVVGTNSGTISGCQSIKMTISRNHTNKGITSRTKVTDLIVNSGTNGFYGKNNGGTVNPIALIQ